jgi:hypothetical protein
MFNLKLMNLICALLLFCICVEALRFPGSVDGRIRRCLLEGLKRLHSNSAPLKTSLIHAETFAFLSRYPVELKQLFFGNLDYKSIKKLSQCNKKAAHFTVPIIAQKLASFNPHFVFDDELVNSLLLAVLDKHFTKSKNLQSEKIHDELQLLILKYSRDDLNFDSIPKNIYFYLISFINEAVYGVDAIFESSISNFCVLLLRFKIPKSYKYYRRFFAKNIFKYSANLPWKHHLKFFSQNPSKEEIRRHFEIPADINDWIKPRQIDDEFIKVVLELFYDEFTDENVVNLYYAWNMFFSFTLKAFIRRFFSIIDEDELMKAYNFHIFYSNTNRTIICNELAERFGKTIDTCCFSTRISLNELSLDRLASFDSETIFKQLKLYSYSDSRIYDFELVVTVINSDLITPKLLFKILKHFIYKSSYDVVELLIKEANQPINFIDYFSCHVSTPLTDYFGRVPEKIFLEFVDSVNDPLICLMILSNFHLEAKNIIQKKRLNLNKVYRIDLKLGFKVCLFVGRTMHFKQMLKELIDPKMNNVFGLDSKDLNHDYSSIDESLPVIIVDKDYTFTLNSH